MRAPLRLLSAARAALLGLRPRTGDRAARPTAVAPLLPFSPSPLYAIAISFLTTRQARSCAPSSRQKSTAFAVNYLGRFANRPTPTHWAAIQHVLRYIKGTLDMSIFYTPDDTPLKGFLCFFDTDCKADVKTSRSTWA